MTTELPPPDLSPSIADGFNGARDARYLSDSDVVSQTVRRVICSKRTRDLLRRAGYARPVFGLPYDVNVVRDRFQRLQIAPSVA